MNYILQIENLETVYKTEQIYPTIESLINDAKLFMIQCEGMYRITITTKSNQ